MTHGPDPHFVEHLEWQVRTAVRRRERFAAPVSGPSLRRLRGAALVLVSLLFGAGVVVAAEHYQDSRDKAYLLARTSIELEMAELEYQFAREAHERVRQLVDSGVRSRRELIEIDARLLETRSAVSEKRLDLEEIRATGQEPRHDLAAPLVGERDFVRERLELEIQRGEARLATAREAFALVRRMHEAAVVSQADVSEAEGRLLEAEGALAAVRSSLALRAAYLAGELSAEGVQLQFMKARLEAHLEELEARLALLRQRRDYEQQLYASGRASSPGRRAELDLRLCEREIQLVRLELAHVNQLLEDADK